MFRHHFGTLLHERTQQPCSFAQWVLGIHVNGKFHGPREGANDLVGICVNVFEGQEGVETLFSVHVGQTGIPGVTYAWYVPSYLRWCDC